MLRYLNCIDEADRVEAAVKGVIGRGEVLTGDLGGRANTAEFTDAVIAML